MASETAREALRLGESLTQATPLNYSFEAYPSPRSFRRPGPGWGRGPDIAPLLGEWRHLGPALARELGERSGCAPRRWGLSISRIDKLPLGEGRAVSPQRRVTQGNLSGKNPLPAESRAGAGRAEAPAPSRAPAPRRSPASPSARPAPPSAHCAVPPGPAPLWEPAGSHHMLG